VRSLTFVAIFAESSGSGCPVMLMLMMGITVPFFETPRQFAIVATSTKSNCFADTLL
jgi:hypothetical protein